MDYQPLSGLFINNVQRGGLAVGAVCGLTKPEQGGGYINIYVDGVAYRAHRLAWKMHHGHDPTGFIHHVNGDRADNRIANLADVAPLENCQRRTVVNSNTGVLGVSQLSHNGLYAADISASNRVLHLGQYDRLECAIAARKLGESILFGKQDADERWAA